VSVFGVFGSFLSIDFVPKMNFVFDQHSGMDEERDIEKHWAPRYVYETEIDSKTSKWMGDSERNEYPKVIENIVMRGQYAL
jgi:hypothetical protein